MNNPIEAAVKWEGHDDFTDVLSWHLQHGYVWSGADAFILGRPMPKDCLEQADEFISWDKNICDVWFVWLAAGKQSLQRFIEVAPFKLPYVAWHRNKKDQQILKIWSWDQYDKVTKKFRRNRYGNKS